MKTTSTWRQIASATILALSIATVWGVVAGWAGSIVGGWFQTPASRYEQIHIAADGTPLIAARDHRDWQNVDYLTLDREPVSLEVESGLGSDSVTRPYQPPALFAEPIAWRQRIGGMPNYSKPFAAWYAVRDAERPGHAYFVGYDALTNSPIAYAGRGGVSPTLPERDEWFDIGEHTGMGHAITSRGYSTFGYAQYVYNQGVATDEGSISQWMAYLKDGDRVLELDTRNKRLRTVAELDGLLSVGVLSEPLPPSQEMPKNRNQKAPDRSGRLQVQPVAFNQDILSLNGNAIVFAAAPGIDSKRKTRQRLVAVGMDELLLIDPKTDTVDRFTLPESLREKKGLSVYSIGEGALLMHSSQWHNREEPGRVDLYWTNADGEITREQTVRLANYSNPTPDWLDVFPGVGIAPIPIAWLAGGGVIGPLVLVDQREAETFGEAYAELTSVGWPALTTVLVVGLLLAAFTWTKHKRLYRPHALLWSGLVFLFGPAGLIAYALHWSRPPKDRCAECERTVPRDRDHCPACGATWPEPAPMGIELVA